METKNKDNRAAAGIYTRITVSLRHLQPEVTKHLPDIDRNLIDLLGRKLAVIYRWSEHRPEECVSVLVEGPADTSRLMEPNRYCGGIIDGYMCGRYDLAVHGVVPSFDIHAEYLERIPDNFKDYE